MDSVRRIGCGAPHQRNSITSSASCNDNENSRLRSAAHVTEGNIVDLTRSIAFILARRRTVEEDCDTEDSVAAAVDVEELEFEAREETVSVGLGGWMMISNVSVSSIIREDFKHMISL